MKNKIIPYGRQSINHRDLEVVERVLKSDFLTTGPMVNKFEQKLAAYVGSKYAVVVTNATAALHLATLVLKRTPQSEGITTPITFLSTANAMVYSGIKPVFADIKANTYNISPAEIEKKITKATILVMPVHFAGQPCEMEKIAKIAKKHHLSVIEDAAHAIGSRYKSGERVGSCKYSDMTVFSFHPVKTMTTGEGGAITTNSKKIYENLKILRNHGIVKNQKKMTQNSGSWYYEMQSLGFNYRLTDIQSALGISQLNRLESFIAKRRRIVNQYNAAFKDVDWLITPFEENQGLAAFHLYVLQIKFEAIGKTREQVINFLKNARIGSQVHYIPVHLQPFYQREFHYQLGDYPVAENYYKQCLSIPLYPDLTIQQVKKIIKTILDLPHYD